MYNQVNLQNRNAARLKYAALLITGLLLKAATEQGLMEASLAKQPTYSPN
jgi:hypothetical protein